MPQRLERSPLVREGNEVASDKASTKALSGIGGALGREKSAEEIISDLFTYHAADFESAQRYETIRDAAKHLALVIWKNCPYGADRTTAIRKLREAVMTANAAIALKGVRRLMEVNRVFIDKLCRNFRDEIAEYGLGDVAEAAAKSALTAALLATVLDGGQVTQPTLTRGQKAAKTRLENQRKKKAAEGKPPSEGAA